MAYQPLDMETSLTIRPTETFFMLGDVMVRAWRADNGTIALVAAVAVPAAPDDSNPLDSLPGLTEIPPPDAVAQHEWARRIIEGEE